MVSFFIITYAITWGIGAIAILFPNQFQALFGELSDRHPFYYVAVAAPTVIVAAALAYLPWSTRPA